jgi:hypothetical protein
VRNKIRKEESSKERPIKRFSALVSRKILAAKVVHVANKSFQKC